MKYRIVAVSVGVASQIGCSGGPDIELSNAIESAMYVEKELAPEKVEPLFEHWTEYPDKSVKALMFPIQGAHSTCNGTTFRVGYNPYTDGMSVSFDYPSEMLHQLQTLVVNNTQIWTNPKKVADAKYLTDFTSKTRPTSNVVYVPIQNLSTKHPELFPSGTEVSVEITGTAIVSRRIGDKNFDYVTRDHPTFRVKLHVFTADMRKAIDQHAKALTAPHAKLYVLDKHLKTIERIRKFDDPKVQSAVRRVEELAAPARKEAAALMTMPFAQYKSALSIDPTCPTASVAKASKPSRRVDAKPSSPRPPNRPSPPRPINRDARDAL